MEAKDIIVGHVYRGGRAGSTRRVERIYGDFSRRVKYVTNGGTWSFCWMKSFLKWAKQDIGPVNSKDVD